MRMQTTSAQVSGVVRHPDRTKQIMGIFLAGIIFMFASFATRALAAPDMSDSDIDQAVTDALVMDPGVTTTLIDVETNAGIVTLSGTVDNVLAKDRATKVAETVKGVRAVVNRITVLAPPRSDGNIQENIHQAWLRDKATESYELTATVEDGIATLSGTVDSWQEKQLAATVAKSVLGVKGIQNDIDINYQQDRRDYEIASEVERALHWDTLVDDGLITVEADNARVTLSGTVGSAAEKTRAITNAWVTGVRSVDADELQVASWARDERFRKKKYVRKTDTEIKNAVESALLYDPRVISLTVDTSIDDGVVSLSGTVHSLKAKRAAAQTARNVVGVWRVKNNLVVRPAIQDDDIIKGNVEQALLTDPYIERYEITVTAVDNEVYLYGDVDTYFEKAQAEDVASKVKGVAVVHNRLVVGDEYDRYTYDPYVDPWYMNDYDWNGYTNDYATTKTDWEIEQDVEGELFWSPFVDADEVTVEVDDGEATLTGTVDNMSERAAAEKNAYDAGATLVDNDLAVEYGPDYYKP